MTANLNANSTNSYSSTPVKREDEHEGNLAAVQNRRTATCNKQEDCGQGGSQVRRAGGSRIMLTQEGFVACYDDLRSSGQPLSGQVKPQFCGIL